MNRYFVKHNKTYNNKDNNDFRDNVEKNFRNRY